MTHQEILEKAIQKAIDGGWDVQFTAKDCFRKWYKKPYTNPDGVMGMELGNTEYQFDSEHPSNLIFNHDFAKALWGEEPRLEHPANPAETTPAISLTIDRGPNWKYHLQQMVAAADPIAYLGENL